ncbi:MAG: hypothetical protein WD397_03735 [Wenzhouxiangellaceae bacterium]
MKTAPTITALVFVGAALSGWLLEFMTATGEPGHASLQELIATLAAWLSARFRAVAEWMQKCA